MFIIYIKFDDSAHNTYGVIAALKIIFLGKNPKIYYI